MELSEITEAMRPIATQYWQTVRSIAEEAQGIDDDDDRDTFIHEQVDGSEWIIYTYAAQAVILITDNENAYTELESLGELASVLEGPSSLYTSIAFHAMRQDVNDHLAALERLAQSEA